VTVFTPQVNHARSNHDFSVAAGSVAGQKLGVLHSRSGIFRGHRDRNKEALHKRCLDAQVTQNAHKNDCLSQWHIETWSSLSRCKITDSRMQCQQHRRKGELT
jgi:hypothetical protein